MFGSGIPRSNESELTPKQCYPMILNILWLDQSKLFCNMVWIAHIIWITQSIPCIWESPFKDCTEKGLVFWGVQSWQLIEFIFELIVDLLSIMGIFSYTGHQTKQSKFYCILFNKLLSSSSAQLRCHYNSYNTFLKEKCIQQEGWK